MRSVPVALSAVATTARQTVAAGALAVLCLSAVDALAFSLGRELPAWSLPMAEAWTLLLALQGVLLLEVAALASVLAGLGALWPRAAVAGAAASHAGSRAARARQLLPWILALGIAAAAWALSAIAAPWLSQRYDRADSLAGVLGQTAAVLLGLLLVAGVARRAASGTRWGIAWPSLLLGAALLVRALEVLVPYLPLWAQVVSAAGILALATLASHALLAALPPRWRRGRDLARRSVLLGVLLLAAVGVVRFKGRSYLGDLVIERSALARATLDGLRWSADLDGDGTDAWLGGGDCQEGDAAVGPFHHEVLDNGIDDNCLGGDLRSAAIAGQAELQLRRPIPAAAAPLPRPAVAAGPSLVLVVTIDAWRADRLGFLEARDDLTPHVDALARRSVVFSSAYAQATHTRQSVPSLWSSRYPIHFSDGTRSFIPCANLFDVLRGEGWSVHSIYASNRVDPTFEQLAPDADWVEQPLTPAGEPAAQELTRRALAWLDARAWAAGERVLLWLHYFDPHLPYLPHAETAQLGWSTPALYDQEVAWSDRAVGALLQGLEARGADRQAIVVISSDHGEELSEHGTMLGHAFNIYENLLRVPLIIHAPGYPARVVDDRVRLLDVVPTLTQLLGVADPVAREGRSLLPLLRGEPLDPVPVFAQSLWRGRDRRAVIWQQHKLIWDSASGSVTLFDLAADPAEQNDLAGAQPEAAARLRAMLGRWWDERYNNLTLALGLGLHPCAGSGLPGAGTAAAAPRALQRHCEELQRLVWAPADLPPAPVEH